MTWPGGRWAWLCQAVQVRKLVGLMAGIDLEKSGLPRRTRGDRGTPRLTRRGRGRRGLQRPTRRSRGRHGADLKKSEPTRLTRRDRDRIGPPGPHEADAEESGQTRGRLEEIGAAPADSERLGLQRAAGVVRGRCGGVGADLKKSGPPRMTWRDRGCKRLLGPQGPTRRSRGRHGADLKKSGPLQMTRKDQGRGGPPRPHEVDAEEPGQTRPHHLIDFAVIIYVAPSATSVPM